MWLPYLSFIIFQGTNALAYFGGEKKGLVVQAPDR